MPLKIGKPLLHRLHGSSAPPEARVWADPQVLDILRNDFVIVALYSTTKSASRERPGNDRRGKVLKASAR